MEFGSDKGKGGKINWNMEVYFCGIQRGVCVQLGGGIVGGVIFLEFGKNLEVGVNNVQF